MSIITSDNISRSPSRYRSINNKCSGQESHTQNIRYSFSHSYLSEGEIALLSGNKNCKKYKQPVASPVILIIDFDIFLYLKGKVWRGVR